MTEVGRPQVVSEDIFVSRRVFTVTRELHIVAARIPEQSKRLRHTCTCQTTTAGALSNQLLLSTRFVMALRVGSTTAVVVASAR
jgi:hypothetical protein